MTRINQNKVAYSRIKELKDQGYHANQIASIWNSGRPDFEGRVGTNKFGVQFDVPAYVSKVGRAYNQIKSATGANVAEASVFSGDNQAPEPQSSLFSTIPKRERRSIGEKIVNTGKFLVDDVFRGGKGEGVPEAQGFVGNLGREVFSSTVGSRGFTGLFSGIGEQLAADKAVDTVEGATDQAIQAQTDLLERFRAETDPDKKARLKVLLDQSQEQLGGLSEDVIEASGPSALEQVGKGANALLALAGGGVATQGVKSAGGLARVAGQEALIGAGFGISDPLSRGETPTGGDIATGAVAGAVGGPIGVAFGRLVTGATRRFTPNILKTVAPGLNEATENRIKQQMQENWSQALGKTKSVADFYNNNNKGGRIDSVLARYAILPEQSIKTGAVKAESSINKLQRHIGEIVDQQTEYASKFNDVKRPLSSYVDDIDDAIRRNDDIVNRGGIDQVRAQTLRKLEGLRTSFGDEITPQQEFMIRKQANADSRSFRVNGDFTGADASKIIADVMRKSLDKLGDGVITQSNREVGDLIVTQRLLEKLNGKKLGAGTGVQYLARVMGTVLGSTTSTESGSFIGGLLGALGGDAVIRAIRSRAFGTPTQRKIIRDIAKNDSVISQLKRSTTKANREWLERQIKKNQNLALPPAPKGAREVRTKIVKADDIKLPAAKSSRAIQKNRKEFAENLVKLVESNGGKITDIVETDNAFRVILSNGKTFAFNKAEVTANLGVNTRDELIEALNVV
jgi:hypothetical protein